MKIKKATKHDLRGVVEISNLMLEHHTAMDPYYSVYSKYEDHTKFYEEKLQDKKMAFFIAKHNNEVVGLVFGAYTNIPRTRAPKIGHALSIFVKEEFRNQGIGEKLSLKLFQWFESKKVKHIEATVDVRNKKALKRWRGVGFKDYQIRLRKDL